MRKIILRILFHLAILLIPSVTALGQKNRPIDPDATRETKKLFKNLKKLSRKHTLFAHQHATEYGHGWQGEEDKSDVKSVTGSHPAMIGVDFSGFSGRSEEAIAKAKEDLRKNVVDTYNRGGITTVERILLKAGSRQKLPFLPKLALL